MLHDVEIPTEELRRFCERNKIRKLSLFGSILTPRFREESDVDMLVEFEPEGIPTLAKLARLEEELSLLVGRKVDLRTPRELSRYFRDTVVANAKVQYERV